MREGNPAADFARTMIILKYGKSPTDTPEGVNSIREKFTEAYYQCYIHQSDISEG